MKRIITLLSVLFCIISISKAQPTAPASGLTFAPISGTGSLLINWTNGTGGVGRIVILKDATGVYTPTNGSASPTGNSDFSLGADLDAGGGVAKCVYNGTASTVTISNISAATRYIVQVYEYSVSAATPTYTFLTALNNPSGFEAFVATGSFTVPASVNKVTAQVWGAGGGGGNSKNLSAGNASAGGGGGGGAYSTKFASVTPGNSYTATVGAAGTGAPASSTAVATAGGDSWFESATSVMAKGGGFGANMVDASTGGAGGAGGLSTAGFGTVKYSGGNGGNGLQTTGGGGGSSAGTAANGNAGNNGQTSTTAGVPGGSGGAAVSGGGAGSDGGVNTDGAITIPAGSFPGGGGGGTEDDVFDAGASGGGGLVIVSYMINPPTATIALNDADGIVKPGQVVRITATFSEPIDDSPVTQLSLSGQNTLALTNMVKSSTTVYYYDHTVGAGTSGTITIALGTGFGTNSGNLITSAPTSGATFTLSNDATPPTASASGTPVTIKSGIASGINIQSNENGKLYIVKNGVTISNLTDITNAIAANTAMLVQGTAIATTNYPVTPLATLTDGAYNVIALDQVDNISTPVSTGITLDNTPPTASAPTSTPQTLNTGSTSSSTVQSTEAGNIYLVKNGVAATTQAQINSAITANNAFLGKSGAVAATPYTITVAASLNDGVYDIVAVDNAGNISAVVGGWLTVDNTPPTASAPISIAQSLQNGSTSSSTVQSSEAGNIYLVKNGVTATTQAQITSAITANNAFLGKSGAVAATAYTVTLAAGLNDGVYDIVAVDNAGNVSPVVPGWLTVDNAPPTASAPTSIPQLLKSGSTSTSTVQSTEAGNIYLVKNGVTATTQTEINTAISANNSFLGKSSAVANTAYTVTLTASLNDGVYDIVAVDNAGNISLVVAGWLTVDNIPPTASAPTSTAQTLNSGSTSSSTVQSTEAGNIYLVKNGTAAATQTQINSAITANNAFLGKSGAAAATAYTVTLAASLNDGVYDIVAVDNAGNVSSIVAGWLTVDNTPPTISIGSPSATIARGASTITFTITYTGATTINLTNGNVTVNSSGASATATVTNGSTSTPTVTLTGFTGNGSVSISIAANTSSDAAGNNNVVTGPSTSVTVDTNSPAAGTVGSLITSGGRVAAGYWNSTNTGLNVTIPLTNTDASLDGGKIQLKIQNTATAGYIDIPGTGVYTITNTDRTAGTKTITVSDANLEAAVSGSQGFGEGLVGDAASGETKFNQITAEVSDLAGNTTTYTKSSTNLDIDQTLPTIVTTFNLYNNKGIQNGNREVIIFKLSEDLYSTGGLVADNTVLVNGTNKTYGGAGFSVDDPGAGSNDVDANYVRYESDGGANSADASVTNTRLIWVESNNNTSNWSSSASPVTRIQYVTFGSGSSAAELMRDAAGNELGTVAPTSVLSGDVIPPFLSPNVMTLSPRAGNPEKIVFTLSEALSTATTANAVTGFTTTGSYPDASIANATYSEASAGVCPCTITLTSASSGQWTSATTVSYIQANGNVVDLASPGNELATITNKAVTMETVAPVITAVSIPNSTMIVGSTVTVTITTQDDDGDDPALVTGSTIGGFSVTGISSTNSTTKSATFTVTEGGTDVPAGSNIPVNISLIDLQSNQSAAFTTAISQANDPIDAHSPTITSITNSVGTIYEGALTQTVTVVYSETMKTSIQPTITITGGGTNWGVQTASGGTNGWVGNTYTATFTHNGTQQTLSGITTSVAVGGAQDAAGNPNLGLATSAASFNLDTRKPQVAAITTNISTVNLTNNTIRVFVRYDESMNTSVAPTISFSNGTFGSPSPVGWTGVVLTNDTYVIDYTNSTTTEEFPTVTVSANGAHDAIGNIQTTLGTSVSSFILDTQKPSLTSINRQSPSTPTNATSVTFRATFSEDVTGSVSIADFTPALSGVTFSGSIVTVVPASGGKQWDIKLNNVSGNGTIGLDLSSSVAVSDVHGNPLSTTVFTGQLYDIDQIAPVASTIDISSPVVGFGVNGTSTSSISWLVTFVESGAGGVFGVDATDFDLLRKPAIPAVPTSDLDFTPGLIVTGSGNTRTVTLTNVELKAISGDAQLYINLKNDGSIVDAAGNALAAVLNSSIVYPGDPTPGPGHQNDYFTILFPEPVNPPTNLLQTGSTTNSFSVTWNQPAAPIPNYYFYQIKRHTDATFLPVLVDGTWNGISFFNSNSGSNPMPRTFSNSYVGTTPVALSAGVTYDLKVISTNYSGNYNSLDILDYLTSSTLDGSFTTATAQNSTITSAIVAPATISSIIDDTPSGQFKNVATFTIDDDGASTSDGAPLKFTTLYITPGASNTIGNWTQAIAGAELVPPSGPAIQGTIDFNVFGPANTSSIRFTGFGSQNATDFGFIADNTSKTYTLRIWLKSTLGGTLPLNIDGQRFDFAMNAANFTLDNGDDQLSSQFALPQTASAGAITVDVPTEGFNFVTQPVPTSQLVLQNFSTPPVVTAVDRNNNRDLGFTGAANNVTVTNTDNIPMNPGNLTSFIITPSSGVITFPSNFQYTGAGNGTLTVTYGSINSNTPLATTGSVASSTVTVNYSNLSTITSGTGTTRVLSTVVNSPGVSVFTFTYTDDGGIGLGDGANTKIDQIVITPDAANQLNWSTVLAGATLSDGTNTVAASNISASGITFSGATFTGSALSTVVDGSASASKVYTLNVWFKTSLGSLAATADQNHLVFSMSTDPANLTLNPTGSQAPVGSAVDSGSGNGLFEVDATLLAFNSDFSGALASSPVPPTANSAIDFLVNVDAATQLLSNPSVQAVDIYGNRDINFSASVTTTAAGGMTLTNPLTSIASGIGTFSGSFAYTAIGNGKLTVATSATNRVGGTLSATTSSNAQSITVKTGTATKINGPSVSAASISSIANASPGSTVFTFSITDDPAGTAIAQNDGNPTKITDIVITGSTANNTIVDWTQVIAGARLEDANAPGKFIDITPTSITSNTLTFSGITITSSGELGVIDDNQTKTYNLKIWLKSNLSGANNYNTTIDGLRFGFELLSANVSTDNTGTSLLPGLNANTTNVSTPVAVIATQLDIISPSSATDASLNSNFPGVVVQARDANANLDSDFNGKITSLTNVTSRTMANGPTIGSSSFTSGVYNFPNTFQFTSGANGDDVTLTIKADNVGGTTGTNCGSNAICSGISPTITLQTSFESSLVLNPAFSIPSTILYLPYQEATNIQNTATSYPLYSALLVDGSRGPGFTYSGFPLNTNTDSGDGLSNTDSDGAGTSLTSLKLRITKPSAIRRIALYANGVEILNTEIDVTAISGITASTASYDFTWTGGTSGIPLNMMTASDDSEAVLSVRVSFRSTSPEINDHDDIHVQLLDATVGIGSQFFLGGGYIAGRPPVSSASFGMIDVVATSLDFVTQPSHFAGKQEPIDGSAGTSPGGSTGIVNARDAFALIDTDFSFTANITAGAQPINYPTVFTNGVLDLTGMQYDDAGDGTLTVTSNGLNSNTPAVAPSIQVDVIHVTAVENMEGVEASESLKGGNTNKRIFGLDFAAEHNTAAEPNLLGFSIVFRDENGNPYPYTKSATDNIFKNFKLYRAEGASAPVVLAEGTDYTLTQDQSYALTQVVPTPSALSKDKLTFVFNTPIPLHQSNYRFFLNVDIDVSVSVGTAAIRPVLVDEGYGTTTNDHIKTSIGSSKALVEGILRKFASTKPPILVLTSPSNGKLNVDPALNIIQLTFDVPVVTFDGVIKVYNRNSGTLRATFTATNGRYVEGTPLSTQVVPTLNFEAPVGFDFKQDTVYYVTVEKGVFSNTDPTQRKGISDEGFNLYGGISYNGTFYFKASSPNAPVLSGTDVTKYYFTPTSATFNLKFNQPGKVHYLVAHPTVPSTAPAKVTNRQILGLDPYANSTVITRGSAIIDQLSPNLQFVTFNATLANNIDYVVYVFAENDAEPVTIKTSAPYGSAVNLFAVDANGPTLTMRKTTTNTNPVNNPRFEICVNSSVKMEEPLIISESTANFDFKADNDGSGTVSGVDNYTATISPSIASYATNKKYLITFTNSNTGSSTLNLNGLGTRTLLMAGAALKPNTIIPGQSYFASFNGSSFDLSYAVQNFNILLPTGFQFDVTKQPTISFNGSDFDPLPIHIDNKDIDIDVVRYRNSALLEVNFINNRSVNFDNIIISNLYLIASSSDIGGNIIRFGGNGLKTIADDRVLARISSGPANSINFTNSYQKAFEPWPYAQIASEIVTYIPDNFASIVKLIPEPPQGDYGASFFTGAGLTNDELTLSAVTLDAAFNITLNHVDQNGCASSTVEQYLVYDHSKALPELLKVASPGISYNVSGTKIGLIAGTPDPVTNIPGLPRASLNVRDSISYLGLAGYQLIDLYADIPKRAKNSGQVLDYVSGWQNIVKKIPVISRGSIGKHPNPILNQVFKTYNWEYSGLVNKDSTTRAGVEYPYDPMGRFAKTVQSSGTGNGKTFFEAGSLGIIEFTGIYQSTADFSVFIPFRQEVEIFIPAIPIVEVNGASSSIGSTPVFCENGSPFTITGYPLATSTDVKGVFTLRDSVTNTVIVDPGFVDSRNGTATFNPTRATLKNAYRTIKIEYTFQQNNSPAVGTGVLYIKITPNPVANFTMKSITGPNVLLEDVYCENNSITFTSTSTIASGIINKYQWDFKDDTNSSGTNPNKPTTETATHKYIQTSAYSPSLAVTSSYGCSSAEFSKEAKVGIIPVVDFSYTGVSTATPISFKNTTVINPGSVADGIKKIEWAFGDGNTANTLTVDHPYSAPNPYSVVLTVTSNMNCVNSIQKSIVVLPQSTPTDANAYNETFEGNKGGNWQVWNTGNATNGMSKTPISWAYGTPSTQVIKIDPAINGSTIWKTNLTGNYNGNERSALYSPSFDLHNLERPMISFNSFVQMEQSDGVVLQYSIDNKNITDITKEWVTLGDIGEGVDWFTNQGIAAKPGDQSTKDLGWSNFDKTKWLTSKHSLAPVQNAAQIVFRFALGSVKPAVEHEGFAVDNVRIGERTRTVLFESFANTSNTNPQEKVQNEWINNYSADAIGTEVVKVNYHVGFPGIDPFNADNPADPSARALYYNVTSTPSTRVDGERDAQDRLISQWGDANFEIRSLQLSQANIAITPTVKADGTISVKVNVTAVTNLPENTILQVVLVEQSIASNAVSSDHLKTGETNFEYVVKKLLPSAAGSKFGEILSGGDTRPFGPFEWTPDSKKLYDLPNDIAIIVFLQNETTKEIYQSELIKNIQDPPLITGLGEISGDDIIVFPNPADREFTIQLPGSIQKGVTIQIVNQVGQFVYTDKFEIGDQKKTIGSELLSEGLYIIQLGEGKTAVRKKLIITHK